jgi:hypothetical protein
MERKKPLRANPETTRAWQQRSRVTAAAKARTTPRTPLPKVGARAKRLEPALRGAYREVDRLDGRRCQFHLLDPTHRCPSNALLHHDHLWGRNVRPDLREKAWAIVTLCSVAHLHYVTDNPVLHRELRAAVLVSRIVDWLCGVAE